ncbi:MAG: hypothetical protein P8O19_07560 [Woeseiaceae bacterium]|jgi:hypothetical protein|nr:hypothetical protein [Woeseiaceae bacterium]MDG1016708.1 hypothetical protein [Woeseiaceae bacterium]
MGSLNHQLEAKDIGLRTPEVVMDLKRLGSFYPYKLSFMRKLIRKVMTEKWDISLTLFNLDKDGFGEAVYEIKTPLNNFHFVVFANFLDPELRSDRVIAEAWDMTVTLRQGVFNPKDLIFLKENVPLQEKGRMTSNSVVLSRANKSSRNFDYVINELSSGKQPCIKKINEVGYLYRTTAVYGSGKFGMADWDKVKTSYADFSEPFSAEMFSCFLIRQFSLDQADHIAHQRNPKTAVKLNESIKRYIGIGNATGLGMAPFLIKHPLLINNWIETRERVLAKVLNDTSPDKNKLATFLLLVSRAIIHLNQITTSNLTQKEININVSDDLSLIASYVTEQQDKIKKWQQVTQYVAENFSIEAQELINTVLIEIYPEEALLFEKNQEIKEIYDLIPEMKLSKLKTIIQNQYQWALKYNFKSENADAIFWYRSEEKMEPRLGERNIDKGADKEMLIGIARSIEQCYSTIQNLSPELKINNVAEFIFAHPEYRQIIRRIQTMSKTTYGEIQANLNDKDVLPIHLLRCKLSFFGVGKFDPKSRLWVRNTMFQGAPIVSDISNEYKDEWFFPVMPNIESSKGNEIH